MIDRVYCYPPAFDVLKNKFDIRDKRKLDYFERELVVQRMIEDIPTGDFDLDHLKAIHRHLFQDVYDWAGELRTVELSKDGHQFQFQKFIRTGMDNVHRRLTACNYLRNLSHEGFSRAAGEIIGDVNYVHPFREGNGRTQLLYLEQLASQADHAIDLGAIDRDRWMMASRKAHLGDYIPMGICIAQAIIR